MKTRLNAVLSATIAVLAANATAGTYTWTPNVSGLWSDATKWSPEGVPAKDDMVDFGGVYGSDTVVTVDSSPTVSFPDSTSISGGGALILQGDSDSRRSLTVSKSGKDIQMKGGPLTIKNLDATVKVTNNGTNNRFFLTGSGNTNSLLVLEGDAALTFDNTYLFLSGDGNPLGSRITIRNDASLNMSGALSLLHLGRGQDTWGGLEQRGGNVTCGGEVVLGNNSSSFGSWEMFSGTSVVSTNIKLAVGSGSNAGLYIHGGKLTLGRYSQFGCAGRSEVFIDGGEMSFPNKTMSLVDRGSDTGDYPSVLTLAGDANVHGNRILPYGDRTGYEGMSRAMVNLNGDSILSLTDTFYVKAATSSSRATLSFNGGTLERITGSPNSDQNLNLLKGMDVVVYPGGGRLRARKADGSASGMVLNNARFRKAGGYGVASITITDGGAGYLLPPLVDITGGSGSNATAIAQIDYETRQVTNVVITCRGEGYKPDDQFSVRFVVPGSPAVSSASATVALSENVSGELRVATGTTVAFGAGFRYDGNFAAEESAIVQITGDVAFGGESAFKNLYIEKDGKLTLAGPATATGVNAKNLGTLSFSGSGSLAVAGYASLQSRIEVACASESPLVTVGGNCDFSSAQTEIVPSSNLPVKDPIAVVSVCGNVTGAPVLSGDEAHKWKLKFKNEDGMKVYYLVHRKGMRLIVK
jgi:hypothetical protein